MDQLHLLTQQLSDMDFNPIFHQKTKLKIKEILEQASFKMRTGKLKGPHQNDKKLIAEYQRLNSLFE